MVFTVIFVKWKRVGHSSDPSKNSKGIATPNARVLAWTGQAATHVPARADVLDSREAISQGMLESNGIDRYELHVFRETRSKIGDPF